MQNNPNDNNKPGSGSSTGSGGLINHSYTKNVTSKEYALIPQNLAINGGQGPKLLSTQTSVQDTNADSSRGMEQKFHKNLSWRRNKQGSVQGAAATGNANRGLTIKVMEDANESNNTVPENVTATPHHQYTPSLDGLLMTAKTQKFTPGSVSKQQNGGVFFNSSVHPQQISPLNNATPISHEPKQLPETPKLNGNTSVDGGTNRFQHSQTNNQKRLSLMSNNLKAESQKKLLTLADFNEDEPLQRIISGNKSPTKENGPTHHIDGLEVNQLVKSQKSMQPSIDHLSFVASFNLRKPSTWGQYIKYICQPFRIEGKFRTRWDVLIIIFALWICIFLPINIAFQPDFLNTLANSVVNRIIDICFMLDILINFRTTIKNVLTGEEIFDSKVIAISYLKGRFFIDLIASIPLDNILAGYNDDDDSGYTLNFQFRIVQMFKLSRILRFTKIISFLNATESVKLSLKLFKLIFYLLIYIHLQACAWFFYTNLDRTWYPIPDLIKNEFHFYDHGFTFTYCMSVWHSVSILDGADMVPVTSHQAIVVSCLVFLSEFIHAHILGTIGVVLHALNHKSAKFQEQIEFVTSTMKNIKLSDKVQKSIIEYISSKQNDMDAQKELDGLLSMISPNLKNQVTQHLFLNALTSVEIFNQNTDIIDFLVNNIEAHQYMAEALIIKQGQKATHLYILASGECEVLVKDQFKKEQFVCDISAGKIFGEVSLLFGTKRTASVRSRDQCTVGALTSESFQDLLQNFPELEQSLVDESRKYRDHWKLFQIKSLDSIPYLEKLPQIIKEELHYKLQLENYEKGAKIVSKGQECQGVYYVISGQLDLVIDRDGKEHLIESLLQGSTLGAISLFNETPFAFTVRAKTNCSLLVLGREELLQMADQIEFLAEAIEDATSFLIHNDVPQCDYTKAKHDHRDNNGKLLIKQFFKGCINRVMALNKSKEVKKLKILELIGQIKSGAKQYLQEEQMRASSQKPLGDTKSSVVRPSLAVSVQNDSSINIGGGQKQSVVLEHMPSPIMERKVTIANRRLSIAQNGSLMGIKKQFAVGGVSNDEQKKSFLISKRQSSGLVEATQMQQDITYLKSEMSNVTRDIRKILNLLQQKRPSESVVQKDSRISTNQMGNQKLSMQMSGIQENELEESLIDSSDDEKSEVSSSSSDENTPKRKKQRTSKQKKSTKIDKKLKVVRHVSIKEEIELSESDSERKRKSKIEHSIKKTDSFSRLLRPQDENQTMIQESGIMIHLSEETINNQALISGQAPSDKIQGLVQKFLNRDFQEPRPPVGDAISQVLQNNQPKTDGNSVVEHQKVRAPPKFSESSKVLQKPFSLIENPTMVANFAGNANSATPHNKLTQKTASIDIKMQITPDIMQLVESIKAKRQADGQSSVVTNSLSFRGNSIQPQSPSATNQTQPPPSQNLQFQPSTFKKNQEMRYNNNNYPGAGGMYQQLENTNSSIETINDQQRVKPYGFKNQTATNLVQNIFGQDVNNFTTQSPMAVRTNNSDNSHVMVMPYQDQNNNDNYEGKLRNSPKRRFYSDNETFTYLGGNMPQKAVQSQPYLLTMQQQQKLEPATLSSQNYKSDDSLDKNIPVNNLSRPLQVNQLLNLPDHVRSPAPSTSHALLNDAASPGSVASSDDDQENEVNELIEEEMSRKQ